MERLKIVIGHDMQGNGVEQYKVFSCARLAAMGAFDFYCVNGLVMQVDFGDHAVVFELHSQPRAPNLIDIVLILMSVIIISTIPQFPHTQPTTTITKQVQQ